MKKAFTLIELLVVVLIIGILAAVAMPQYQKAVEKSRIATALPVMDAVKKNMDIYLLENGYPKPNNEFLFLWESSSSQKNTAESAIDVRAGLDCSGSMCTDGTFFYEAICGSGSCYIVAYRSMATYNGEGDYSVQMYRDSSTNEWEYSCTYFDDFGQRACSTLQGQGNWQIIDGNE